MLAGTKFSVDHLLPRSEELLSHTQRQERAISHIQDDLKEKTDAIMKELDDVERELHVTKMGESTDNSTMAWLVPTPQPLQQRPPSLSSQPVAMPLIDNEANTTRGPSVVFPSIQKKPIVANSYTNSSFTYQYGKNKFGVEVRENHSVNCFRQILD